MDVEKGNGHETQNVASPPLQYGRADFATPGRRSVWPWIIFALVLVLLVIGISYFVHNSQAQQGTTGSGRGRGGGGDIPVVAAIARRGDMPVYLDGLGVVQAYYSVTVKTRVNGQLNRVDFKEGQIVNKGDELALVDPKPYQATLDTAKGQLQKDLASLEGAQNDLDIYKSVKPEAMPKQQLQDQQATVDQLKGTVESDKAQVESAQVNLDYCTITAPFTGKVGLRLVDPGNIVQTSDAGGIVVLNQLQPIALTFSLAEDSLPQVEEHANSGPPLMVIGLDRSRTHELARGHVLAIDNQIDPTTGTFKIKAEFANENFSLVPNQFINARLNVDTLKNVVIVPSAAVQGGATSDYVYVVKLDDVGGKPDGLKGTVQLREVKVGHTEGNQTVIESGVADNETVVTDGLDKLTDKAKVSVKMQSDKNDAGATTRPGAATRTSHGGKSRGSSTQPAQGAEQP